MAVFSEERLCQMCVIIQLLLFFFGQVHCLDIAVISPFYGIFQTCLTYSERSERLFGIQKPSGFDGDVINKICTVGARTCPDIADFDYNG